MSLVILTTRSCALGLVKVMLQGLVTVEIVNFGSRLISSFATVPNLIPESTFSVRVTRYSRSLPGHGRTMGVLAQGRLPVMTLCELMLRNTSHGALVFTRFNAKSFPLAVVLAATMKLYDAGWHPGRLQGSPLTGVLLTM